MFHVHPTVLIVDDDDDARSAMKDAFRTNGYGVETARNGRDALAQLTTVHPCVIVLDLEMPVMSGQEFRAAQLADGDLRHIPVVLCSAARDLPAIARLLHVAGYLAKATDLTPLFAIVAACCLK